MNRRYFKASLCSRSIKVKYKSERLCFDESHFKQLPRQGPYSTQTHKQDKTHKFELQFMCQTSTINVCLFLTKQSFSCVGSNYFDNLTYLKGSDHSEFFVCKLHEFLLDEAMLRLMGRTFVGIISRIQVSPAKLSPIEIFERPYPRNIFEHNSKNS